jgi:hypothetical protein
VVRDYGRETISPFDNAYNDAAEKGNKLFRKLNFTKIRCNFHNNMAIVQLRSYDDGDDIYIPSDDQRFKRSFWADHVVDKIMKCIRRKPINGQLEVTDVREQALKNLFEKYNAVRRPEYLKQLLDKLVDGTGVGRMKAPTRGSSHGAIFAGRQGPPN